MFRLKKIISFWLMPVPLCLAMLAASFLVGLRWKRTGRVLAALATLCLILGSSRYVSNALVSPLESAYPAIPEFTRRPPESLAGCAYVVVLGSSNTFIRGLPANTRLSASGLARLVEAVRILRALPDARLLVSGPGEPGSVSHATVLAQAAGILGVDPARILKVDTARDTEEEAAAVARMAGTARVALVTSAWHMPRAAILFRHAGVRFVACPTDYSGTGPVALRMNDFAWASASLERSTLAFHEYLGLLWLDIRGLD